MIYVFFFYYLATVRSLVVLENLVLLYPFKEFTAFREIRLFITAFGRTLLGDFRSVLELYIVCPDQVGVPHLSTGRDWPFSRQGHYFMWPSPFATYCPTEERGQRIRYCSRESNREPPE